MNPVDRIREQRRQNTLQELAARPRRKRIVNLNNIRTIGLIGHDLTDEERVTIEQFSNVMKNRGTIVRKIELPRMDEGIVDKLGFPKSDFTQLFTTYQYDLLIDLTPPGDVFGLYVTLTTSSSLRVGYIDSRGATERMWVEPYDFIIRGEGECDMAKYLTEVLKYLTQIRK